MVKNRATKMAARVRASEEGIPYTRALVAGTENRSRGHLQLVLGLDRDGNEVAWPGRFSQRVLAIQGPAASGKTMLMERLATQALGQAEVYVCSNSGQLSVPRAAGHGDGVDSSVELIRGLGDDMKAAFASARAHLDSLVPEKERRSLAHRVRRMDVGLRQLPADQQPPRRVLLIDDFDLLCRNWQWTGRGDIRSSAGPQELVHQLVREGGAVDFRVVVTGESISRNTSNFHGSKMLLGPNTLAERESFLDADEVGDDPGRWAGLFERYVDDAIHVRLIRD